MKKISLLKINILYLVSLLLFLAASLLIVILDIPFELTILITHIGILILFPMLFLKIGWNGFKQLLPRNDLQEGDILRMVSLSLYSLPVVAFLNLSANLILEYFNLDFSYELPLKEDFLFIVIEFILIGVIGAIIEEVFFRGIILGRVKEYMSPKKASLFVAFLFATFHMTPANFVGPLYLGYVYGLVSLGRNSLVGNSLAHMLNNSIVLVLSYVIILSGVSTDASTQMTFSEMAIAIGFWGVLAAWGIFMTYRLLQRMKLTFDQDQKKSYKWFAMIPIFISMIIFISINLLEVLNV